MVAPGGDEIVYEMFSNDQSSLLIKNILSGAIRTLTVLSDVTPSSDASWSPNGKKILYRDSWDETYTIWSDGSHRSTISDGDSYTASWSPDGNKIAFSEGPSDESISISGEHGDVTWIPVAKGSYQQIGAPSWSPDGTKLLFTMSGTTEDKQQSALFSLDIVEGGQVPALLVQAKVDKVSWQAKE